jgi:predicted membrane channel-forming protein YqfA (hemolysin III family)
LKVVTNSCVLAGVILTMLTGMLLLDPIPQDPAYHAFADQRVIAGIANLCDILSNLPFLIVGCAGLSRLSGRNLQFDTGLRWAVTSFFLGVALTAFGSTFYHLQPDNTSLVWDRLPMTLAFMGLVTLIVGEYINVALGRVLLWPLLAVGVGSVLWWQYTEQLGRGDLRLYGLVQFLPMLLLPLVLLMYPPRWSRSADYWMVGGWYLLAKLLELFDRNVFTLTGWISGHTLKHLAAAMAAWWLLRMLKRRSLLQKALA